MRKKITVLQAQSSLFGLYGAFTLSFLFLLSTWVLAPSMFNDGQYGMSFMVTFPTGWLIGSFIGLVRIWNDTDIIKPHYPSLVSFGLIAGGCVLLPIFGMIFMMLFLGFMGSIIGIF